MSRLCRRTGDVRRYDQQEQQCGCVSWLIPCSILDPKFTDHPAPECLIRWVWRGSLLVFKPTIFWGCPHFDPELRNMYQCTTRPLDFHQAACYWILPLKFWPAKVPNSKPAQRKSCTLSLSNRWNDFSWPPHIGNYWPECSEKTGDKIHPISHIATFIIIYCTIPHTPILIDRYF